MGRSKQTHLLSCGPHTLALLQWNSTPEWNSTPDSLSPLHLGRCTASSSTQFKPKAGYFQLVHTTGRAIMCYVPSRRFFVKQRNIVNPGFLRLFALRYPSWGDMQRGKCDARSFVFASVSHISARLTSVRTTILAE